MKNVFMIKPRKGKVSYALKMIMVIIFLLTVMVVSYAVTVSDLLARVIVPDNEPVLAPGSAYGSVNVTIGAMNAQHWSSYSAQGNVSWTALVMQTSMVVSAASGVDRRTDANSKFNLYCGAEVYSKATFPDVLTSEINSITWRARVASLVSLNDADAYWGEMYWSLGVTYPAALGSSFANADYDNYRESGVTRISAVQTKLDRYVGEYLYIDIPEQYWPWLLQYDNYIYIHLASENQRLLYDFGPKQEGRRQQIGFDNQALIVNYIVPAADRDITVESNAALDPIVTTDKYADNITLETPRTLYNDEQISARIDGESGAAIELELRDTAGTVIESASNSVRVDGSYYWNLNLDSSYTGYYQVYETNNNISSEWFCIQPAPDSTSRTNYTYAGDTRYPQWTNEFDSYVVNDGNYMYVHWKTNIPTDNLTSYYLVMCPNGERTKWYQFSWIADSYLKGSETNKNALIHWRYMVFTPARKTGVSTYDGLVNSLDYNVNPAMNRGFIQSVVAWQEIEYGDIVDWADCHSAYWYLSVPANGVHYTLNKNTVSASEKPVVKLVVGAESQVTQYLKYGYVGHVVQHPFSVVSGSQDLILNEQPIGSYTVSTVLYGTSHNYEYRYDMSLSIIASTPTVIPGTGVTDPTPGGLLNTIMAFFSEQGWDSEVGRWILLLCGMVLLFLLAYRSEILRVVFPLLLLGAALIAGWVDRWLLIILGLGLGVWLFVIFRKRTHGDNAG